MFPIMASETRRATLPELLNQGAFAERVWHMAEWAELIRNDLGAFIEALDRLYTDMQTAGRPASRDFLTAISSKKE